MRTWTRDILAALGIGDGDRADDWHEAQAEGATW